MPNTNQSKTIKNIRTKLANELAYKEQQKELINQVFNVSTSPLPTW